MQQTPTKTNGVDPDDVDAMLAQEMNEMSIQEREEVYEEIHGVHKKVNETPLLLQEKLCTMEAALREIPNNKKQAYIMAEGMNRNFVNDPKFRLMFIRAERYDASKAALRMVKFMETKLEVFGKAVLARPVYFSDLTDAAQAIIKSGAAQYLPTRDRAGRIVVGHFKPLMTGASSEEMMCCTQALLYMAMTGLMDEESQRNGLVFVGYYMGLGRPRYMLPMAGMAMRPYFLALPFDVSSVHLCTNDPAKRVVIASMMTIMNRETRVKRRVHYGDHMEVQYSLLAYGIDVSAFPVTHDGVLKMTNHTKWVQRRQAKEFYEVDNCNNNGQNVRLFDGIEVPNLNDVLLGRGKIKYKNPGNVRMRELVEMQQISYESAKGKDKWKVVESVLTAVKRSSGRFLEKNKDDWWIEISDEQAMVKIRRNFTSISRLTCNGNKNNNKNNNNNSDDGGGNSSSSGGCQQQQQVSKKSSGLLSVPAAAGGRAGLPHYVERTDGKRSRIDDDDHDYQPVAKPSLLSTQHHPSSSSSGTFCLPKGFCTK